MDKNRYEQYFHLKTHEDLVKFVKMCLQYNMKIEPIEDGRSFEEYYLQKHQDHDGKYPMDHHRRSTEEHFNKYGWRQILEMYWDPKIQKWKSEYKRIFYIDDLTNSKFSVSNSASEITNEKLLSTEEGSLIPREIDFDKYLEQFNKEEV